MEEVITELKPEVFTRWPMERKHPKQRKQLTGRSWGRRKLSSKDYKDSQEHWKGKQ